MKTTFLSLLVTFTISLFTTVGLCKEDAKGQHCIAVVQGESTHCPDVGAAAVGARLLRGKVIKAGFEHSPKALPMSHKSEGAMLLGTLRRVPQQYLTIQAGINASVHGDTVLVSEGTYVENIKYRGKKIIVASLFLLDQDTSHISRTIIDGSQFVADSGSTVSFVSGEDTNSVLCGFTVRGGHGTYIPTWDEVDGGGVFLWQSGGRLVRNIITGNTLEAPNTWGGGVSSTGFANVGQTLIMEQNIVSRNTVTGYAGLGYGGGVAVYVSQFRLIGNVFEHDSSSGLLQAGGGGAIIDGTAGNQHVDVIRGNVFRNNSVVGDSLSVSGGIVMLYTGAAIIDNNVIDNNAVTSLHTSSYGGGISIWEDSAASPEKQIIGNSIRQNNVSSPNGYAYGGALFNNRTSVQFAGNIVEDNAIEAGFNSFGGGIYALYWGGRMENNIVARNSGNYGGGIGEYGAPPSGVTQVTTNNTVRHNTSEFGGGLYAGSNTTFVLLNNIFWDDSSLSGPEIYSNGTLEIHYSNIEGGWSGGTGNINADPIFADTLYRLANASPCIGAGRDSVQIAGTWYRAPARDFSGNSRPTPAGSQPDMGASENPRATPTSVGDGRSGVPATFALSQNYPNPFNPTTMINYQLPMSNWVTLKVFDILGREVAILVNQEQNAGTYRLEWNAAGVAGGVYFCRLQAASFVETKKLMLVR